MIKFFRDIWVRLTWCHILSIHPKAEFLKDGKWYRMDCYLKKDGKNIIFDDIKIYVAGENDTEKNKTT